MKLLRLAPAIRQPAMQRPRQPMRTAWTVWGGLLCGGLLAAGVYAPAAWLAAAVQHGSQGRVLLLQPQGTLWQGSAAVALSDGSHGHSQVALSSRWSWSWQRVGWGWQLRLQSPCCTAQPVRLTLQGRHWVLEPGSMQLPLAWLQGLGSPWNTLQLRGEGHLQWQRQQLEWTAWGQAPQWQGQAQLQLRSVATSLSMLPQVGTYALDMQGGAQPHFELKTLRGALQLQGVGQWGGRGVVFRGEAHAQPEYAEELANLLTLIGRRDGEKVVIRWG